MEDQKDIGILLAVICLTMISVGMGVLTFMSLHRKKMLEKKAIITAIENEKKMEVFKAATAAEEKQKEKIARNIHDSAVSTLSAVIRSVDKNIKDYPNNKFNIERLQKDLLTIEETTAILRGISHDLIPANFLSHGLINALSFHIDTIKELENSKADFENRSEFIELLPFTMASQLNIYRICLEVINNLLKHAKYNYLKVTLERDENNLLIEFIHDGLGLTNDEVKRITGTRSGLGLNSIIFRTLILGADINYTVETDYAVINLKIPFNNEGSDTHRHY